MFMKSIRILFSAFLVFSILGCSSGSSDSKTPPPPRETDEPLSELDKASCEFKAEDGGVAPAFVADRKAVTSHFKKTFDESLLVPLLSASSTEVVRFAKFANVEFYSVAAMSKRSCQNLAFIPEASLEKTEVFNDIQNKRPNSTLLGVYFSPENKDFKGQNKDAFILVRKDTTKWTLVHEYMHHLFSREEQGFKKDNDLIADFDVAFDEFDKNYKDYEKTLSNQSLLAAVKNLETVTKIRLEILRRFTLEEITIETILMAHHKGGRLTQVPQVELRSAKSYIKSNNEAAEKADKEITNIINISVKELNALEKEAPELASQAQAVNKQFADHKIKLRSLITEANDLYYKSVWAPTADLALKADQESLLHGPGCNHGKGIEDMVSAATNNAISQLEN